MSTYGVQHVLDFLSGLDRTRETPTLSVYQDSVVHLTDTMTPRIDKALGTDAFPHLIKFLMKHELLIKFLKMKPPTFQGTESEDTF